MTKITGELLVEFIVRRLELDAEKFTEAFQSSVHEEGVRYCVIDNLLPDNIAERISHAFPNPESMRLMNSFREKKYTSKSLNEFDPLVGNITFAIQDPRVARVVEKITGIKDQIPDSSLYAGGLSSMVKGHYLGPHIDNSHDGSRTYYRTLNLLYYVTPNWCMENGGNLELWDERVLTNPTIVSHFNRMAIMETTPSSWHSVSQVRVDGVRKCISNYYFSSRSPIGEDYFNVISFSARPEQRLLRVIASVDNQLRQTLRKFVPHGLGKKDVFKETKK